MRGLKVPRPDSKIVKPAPLVSVLIPARDEEANIEACLESLQQQDHPNFEILVLDDNSSDSTANSVECIAAKDKRIRLIRGEVLPEGWAGMAESCAGVTGQKITGDDVVPMGKEVLKIERDFNTRAGFTAEDDRPPEFMRYEELPPHNVVWTVTDEALDEVFSWVYDK